MMVLIGRPEKYIQWIASVSILLITVFPIFGSHGEMVRSIGLCVCGILGLALIFWVHGYIPLNRFLIGYALYICWSFLSLLWCINLSGGYIRLIHMMQSFAVGTVCAYYCTNRDNVHKLLNVYLFGTIIISLYCFTKDFATLSVWARLGRSTFDHAGQNIIYYSCMLITAAMIALYRVFEQEDRRTFNMTIFTFVYLCGLLTAVRKCLIIPVIFAVVYLFLKNRKSAIKLIFTMAVLSLVGAMAYDFIIEQFPSMGYRIQSLVSDVTSDTKASTFGNSYSERKWLRTYALEVFNAHPLFGIGIGQFRFYAARYGLDLFAHNNFLEVLANTGIIGFLIYYSNYWFLARKSFYSIKNGESTVTSGGFFCISFIVALLIMEYGQVDYYQPYTILILVLMNCLTDNYQVRITLNREV